MPLLDPEIADSNVKTYLHTLGRHVMTFLSAIHWCTKACHVCMTAHERCVASTGLCLGIADSNVVTHLSTLDRYVVTFLSVFQWFIRACHVYSHEHQIRGFAHRADAVNTPTTSTVKALHTDARGKESLIG